MKAGCGPTAQSSSLTDVGRPKPLADDGQTTTEYAVVLGVVVIALASAMFALEGPISSFIGRVASELATLLS
jgi:Flp pilus assembly pilin Flp